jgi:hypothetical protein
VRFAQTPVSFIFISCISHVNAVAMAQENGIVSNKVLKQPAKSDVVILGEIHDN